jgi:hypothetical protein
MNARALPIAVVFRKQTALWLVEEWVKRELVPCFDVARYLFVIGDAQGGAV